jgi:glutaminyl-tRNA synthetase
VSWLGFEWAGDIRYSSSYFDKLYGYAIHLIENGDAYVCDLSVDEARVYRGTLKEPGKNSPYRDRSVEENLVLFEKMRGGECDEGSCVLRAKIDMSAPNINLRDPTIYRIRKVDHHQTKDEWCIYPTYDFTHGQSDAEELVTHSICTLEFEDHRPLYEWFLAHLPVPAQPKQIEFSRLNLNYTVTSKRKLKQLVDEGHVNGWNDPRMPTISGLRRRGYTPLSLRNFCERIGVTRKDGVVDVSVLEHAIREDLDASASRAMCVLNPVKVVLENYPEYQVQALEVPRHPQQETMGKRTIFMSREIYIDRADFEEVPPPKWKRWSLEGAVRLRGSYVIKCTGIIRDSEGNITELRGTYDTETLGVNPQGYKAKGVVHWVSEAESVAAEVRQYDRLFLDETPDAKREDGKGFLDLINPDSLQIFANARAEKSLAAAQPEDHFQFEREGYFTADPDSNADKLVFNRTVSLRDSWAKAKK